MELYINNALLECRIALVTFKVYAKMITKGRLTIRNSGYELCKTYANQYVITIYLCKYKSFFNHLTDN